MDTTENGTIIDSRIVLYKSLRIFLGILLVGIVIKVFILDSVIIKTNQMRPVLEEGDRVLLFKLPDKKPFSGFLSVQYKTPVLFSFPREEKKFGTLRTMGYSGDQVNIESGIFSNDNCLSCSTSLSGADMLPGSYSPRDNMAPYHLPEAGEYVLLDTLSLRDFIWFVSLIKQNDKRDEFEMTVDLLIGDSVVNDYLITGFSVYTGQFNLIPDSLSFDWFFWDRLREHLRYVNDTKERVDISPSLSYRGKKVTRHALPEKCVFLLAEDWINGYDSRYFGPVLYRKLRGSLWITLWSFEPVEKGRGKLRTNRIGRIIR